MYRLLAATLCVVVLAGAPALAQAPREERLFDNGWRFHLGEVTNGQSPSLRDSTWRAVDLPHDWSIEGRFSPTHASGTGFLPGGIGWYRKTFTLPGSMRARKVAVRFDGVYRDSTVWITAPCSARGRTAAQPSSTT